MRAYYEALERHSLGLCSRVIRTSFGTKLLFGEGDGTLGPDSMLTHGWLMPRLLYQSLYQHGDKSGYVERLSRHGFPDFEMQWYTLRCFNTYFPSRGSWVQIPSPAPAFLQIAHQNLLTCPPAIRAVDGKLLPRLTAY